MVCQVDPDVPVDVDSARPAELPPLLEEIPVLVEDLDAAVAAVADEQAPPRTIASACGVFNSPVALPFFPRS